MGAEQTEPSDTERLDKFENFILLGHAKGLRTEVLALSPSNDLRKIIDEIPIGPLAEKPV